jgi:hypothetical protein
MRMIVVENADIAQPTGAIETSPRDTTVCRRDQACFSVE